MEQIVNHAEMIDLELYAEELPEQNNLMAACCWASVGCFGSASSVGSCVGSASCASTGSCVC